MANQPVSDLVAFAREIPVRHVVDVFVAVAELRRRLKILGAYLPNAV